MVAVWWSVLGALVVIIVQIGFALVIRPREAVHALVSDHEFGPWTDVWRVDQRDFGGQKVGRVLQCFRALVEGVPVELLHEGDQRVRCISGVQHLPLLSPVGLHSDRLTCAPLVETRVSGPARRPLSSALTR